MKKIIIASLLAASTLAGAENTRPSRTYDAKITRVIDGDTVAFEANWLPDPLKKELSIRVYGVDTPEKGFRAKCDEENKAGHDATDFTTSTIAHARKLQITIIDWDKYGGRVLGDVLVDGKSLRKLLIDNKFAREYYGEAKQSWCPANNANN